MSDLLDIILDPKSINVLELADKDGHYRMYEQLTYILFGSKLSQTIYVVMRPFERIGVDDDELCVFKLAYDEQAEPYLRIVRDELTTIMLLDIYHLHYEDKTQSQKQRKRGSFVDDDLFDDFNDDFHDDLFDFEDDENSPKAAKHQRKNSADDTSTENTDGKSPSKGTKSKQNRSADGNFTAQTDEDHACGNPLKGTKHKRKKKKED